MRFRNQSIPVAKKKKNYRLGSDPRLSCLAPPVRPSMKQRALDFDLWYINNWNVGLDLLINGPNVFGSGAPSKRLRMDG